MAVAASHSNNQPSIPQLLLEGVYSVGLSAGTGALTGYVFGVINPIGGLAFGAASALVGAVGRGIASHISEDNMALKVATYALTFIAGIAASVAAVTLLGFPITLGSFILLTLGMMVTGIAIELVIATAKCYSACIGGAVLAATT